MIRQILRLIWNKKHNNTLLFLEIFFAFIILFGVFTIVTRFMRMYQTPLGFDTENIWLVNTNFDQTQDTAAMKEMKLRLKNELVSKPEILAASFTGFVTPLGYANWTTSTDANGFSISTKMVFGDRDYLDVMGMELVQGRWFDESDRDARYTPVVISNRFYNESFQGKNLTDSVYTIDGENKIVGVVRHFKYQGDFTNEDNVTFFYQEADHMEMPNLLLRIAPGTPVTFEEEVNRTIAEISKTQNFTIEQLHATRSRKARQVWIPITALLSVCAFLVINISMGLFGVLWYSISKRKSEIGLRRTLGATKAEITTQFVAEVTLVSLAGILLGLIFAIQMPLLKVFPIEHINYYIGMGLSAGLILLLVLLCSIYPSIQASRIHPALALHEE